jgi:hypothetical protein
MPAERKRTITPLMIGRPLRQVPFGRTTERFFVEGEQHEAQQWQDVTLPPDDEPEPKRRGGSIDKVPRQRGAMVALSVFALCLMFGLGAGASALLKTENRLDTFLSLFKASPPPTASEQAGPTVATDSPPMQAAPLASEASQPRPQITTPPTPSAVPPAPDPVPVPAIVQSAPTVERMEAEREAEGAQDRTLDRRAAHGTEKTRGESAAKRRGHDSRHPHDNYVWSQELNALVPVSSMAEPDSDTAASSANSPPKQPSRVERPDPFERKELTPPRLHASTIAPATTGAPTAERPAPNSDKVVDPFEK